MNVRGDLGGELLKEKVDDLNVDMRREQADGVAGAGTGCADEVEPVVLRLSDGDESLAPSAPASGQRALLAEAGLLLEVDLYSLVGVLASDCVQPGREFFLKASWASGSDRSWRGRGARYEKPIRCSQS